MNISTVDLDKTARTCQTAASLRAQYISKNSYNKVIELCVGPSLRILEKEYSKYNIECWGNDIDARWQRYYPEGRWLIGNALNINYNSFNSVIFAPPLSKGCTGKREDALSALAVEPSYISFLESFSKSKIRNCILVLPGRSLSTKEDRKQTHFIINKASQYGFVKTHSLVVKGVLKYLDLEICKF